MLLLPSNDQLFSSDFNFKATLVCFTLFANSGLSLLVIKDEINILVFLNPCLHCYVSNILRRSASNIICAHVCDQFIRLPSNFWFEKMFKSFTVLLMSIFLVVWLLSVLLPLAHMMRPSSNISFLLRFSFLFLWHLIFF